MPRGARIAFENSFLHVFNRGINKQQIFLSDEDYGFFLKKIFYLKEKYDHSIYALCVMPNHFHISLKVRKSPISKIMSSLTTSYSMYFNRVHKHYGPVFQNRFKSILVENNNYFLTLSRYIYVNPVKAGLVNDPQKYPYSTFSEAIGNTPPKFLGDDIKTLVGETQTAVNSFKNFVYEGLTLNLNEIDQIFENEEQIEGSNLFSTRSIKKYVRRRRNL